MKKAMTLNDAGVKAERTKRPKKPKPPIPMPEDLAAALALKKNAKARATWEGFAPSHNWEYLEWITEAKRDETRAKRLAQTVEWLGQRKQRNWKHM